jgi:predicted RNase H-like HicB family nuclease
MPVLRQVILHPAEEGGYWVEVPSLPGCFSQGENKEEALENIKEAIALHIEDMIAAGEDVPADVAPISVETVNNQLDHRH